MSNIKVDYILIRSRRKTIALYITGKATVEVRAPLCVSQAEIDRFVTAKRSWINKHLAVKKQHLRDRAAFTLTYGSTVSVQGRECPITAIEGKRAGFDGDRFFLPPGLPPEEIKTVIMQVYRRKAKTLLTDKVGKYAKMMGLNPLAVKINGAKTRWGSCSAKNSINFSWRLIMADDDIIDYVVVHELAHIKEHNHSDRFWAIIQSVIPDFKQKEMKLKMLQDRLAGENWQ